MSPIFSKRNIPVHIKIGFSFFTSCIVLGYESAVDCIVINDFMHLAYFTIKELLIGFTMGYVTTLMFSAILTAGQIMDTQIGFGIVNVIDPQNNIQIPLLGNFNNILALIIFFIIDGHHTLIELLIQSFDAIPLGKVLITPETSMQILNMFIKSFALSFKLALPIVGATLLTDVALGVMVRIIPQMNVFVLGIPVKILVGLIGLFLFIPTYISFLNGAFSDMFSDMQTLLRGMTPK